jgi:hypothetical protein
VVIWYIFPVLVYCTTKNLATLLLAFKSHICPDRYISFGIAESGKVHLCIT